MDNGLMQVNVSPICEKDGEKFAYVSFTDGTRSAEGKIPECVLVKSDGFTAEEEAGLEAYMKQDLERLKELAAGLDVLGAVIKE